MATISGGDKLEAALKGLAAKVTTAKQVEIGFLAGATAADGQSIPLRAALNEFGVPSRNQPPRPFFRNMIAAKSPEWPAAVGQTLKAANMDAAKALDLAGQAISGQLVQSIVGFRDPPLAASTIARKGFDKPLIDTGDMSRGVNHRVD